MKKMVFVFLGVFCFFLTGFAATNILHKFAGGADDGSFPFGSLIQSGTTFYGVTNGGGDNDYGTIFKIASNGTGYAILHEFAGGDDDGCYPYGPLVLSGTTLYGMTYSGGNSDLGTIFKVETDGTGFDLVHTFTGGADDGSSPECASLIISGNTLFGVTFKGGNNDLGTIFQVDINGARFRLVYEFHGGSIDGANPTGSIVLVGNTFYGMTRKGGGSNLGTIFKYRPPDGEMPGFYFTLHEFAGGENDGATPYGSLLLSGSTFYGMTYSGGDSNNGTVFKIENNGTGFTLLHEFAGGDSDGAKPYGSLILSGGTLYGMTSNGGNPNMGTLFKIGTNGSSFYLLHEFAGGTDDGSYPNGALLLYGKMLYGITDGGGISSRGMLFALPAVPVAGDFDDSFATDLVWRHYAADGGNTIWLMSESIPGTIPGEEERGVEEGEGKRVEGSGLNVAGEGNEVEGTGYMVQGEEENTGNDKEEFFVGAGNYPARDEVADSYESSLPEGEGLSTEYPEAEYPGPFGNIYLQINVPLPALADLKWKIVGTGDFNGDYKEDILWRYYGTGGSNAVWLMAGTLKTSSVAIPAQSELNWEIVGTGDFNNDLNVDILWRHKTNGKNMIWLMNGLTRSSIVNLPAQINLTWKIVGCGDFNGDNKVDILWRFQGPGGKNQVWIMNGTARQSIVNIKAETNLNWKIAGVGDYNKDGKGDIIWRNYSAGGANRVWIMNNTTYVRNEPLPAVADLNWKIEN